MTCVKLMTEDWKTSTPSCLMNVSASSRKNVPFNIDFPYTSKENEIIVFCIHINEPHLFDRTMTASERVKAGVHVKAV